jgi:SM-20-related protein
MNSVNSAVFDLEGDDLKLVDNVRKKYVDTGLIYGWKSNHNRSYDFGHWNKLILSNSRRYPCDHNRTTFLNRHPEIQGIWEIIQSTIGPRGFYRTYINGYTFGTDGYSHQDDTWINKAYGNDSLSETSIIYLNPTWNIDWCGETVVYKNLNLDENNDIDVSVLPKLGRVFVFRSNKLHASRPLSRSCPELRAVLVIKTIDPSIISKQVNFITDITTNVKHSGRTFFEHLFGTMLKIENREEISDNSLLLAGLYHSIYGTESFKYENSEITRELIQSLIGTEAEYLVNEFCNMKNRVNTLMTNSNDYNSKVLKDLITIEIANLMDQNFNSVNSNKITALDSKLKTIVI